MTEPQAPSKVCGYPNCPRAPAPTEPGAAGRPTEYCDDPSHTRAAAWRARRRQASPTRPVDDARPVDSARQRAGEIRGQVTGMAEHLGQQLASFLEELRTLADPEAVEAQLESVTSEAAERVAVAAAQASRAAQAQSVAERQQAEADAAAAEACELAENLQVTLDQTRAQVLEHERDRDVALTALDEARAAAETERAQAQTDLAQLRQELAGLAGRLQEAEQDRNAATSRADAAAEAHADAEQRASAAIERASAATTRAETADATTIAVRTELDTTRAQREQLLAQASGLRESLATAIAELAAARADIDREKTFGEQRVQDARSAADEQLNRLRVDLAQARTQAQDQRTRADRAEGQLADDVPPAPCRHGPRPRGCGAETRAPPRADRIPPGLARVSEADVPNYDDAMRSALRAVGT